MAVMSGYTPGVQVSEQTALFPGYVIRGLTSDNLKLSVENRVSVFQDGISTSKAIGAHTEFFDMDRVEVLKGPQGTLFGRSAQIGAIHLITKHAQDETSANLSVGTGNFNQMRANGYVNVPLLKDKLFARVAAIYNKRDGYINNLSNGTLMGKNTLAARASFKYLPTKKSAFDVILNYEDDNNPGQDFKSGTFAPKGGDTSPFTFANLGTGNQLLDKRKVLGATGQYKQYFNNSISLTAITGYRKISGSSWTDSDGTKAQALDLDINVDYDQFSQEARLNYDGERFSGFAGANYFHEYGNETFLLTQDERSAFAMLSPLLVGKIPGFKAIPMIVDGEPNLSLTTNPLTRQPLQTAHKEKVNEDGAGNNAFDVFADGTFKVTPKFKITAGGRLVFENLTTFYRVDPSPGTLSVILKKGVNNIFKPTVGRLEKSGSYSDWVGRFVMQYDFSKEVSAYASWSKGRRPNVIQVDADTTQYLRAELVYNYEAGIKNMLFNNRLQFNVSAFYYDYRNFQTSSAKLTGAGLYSITDAGKASGKGLETEFQFAATKSLTVFANYAYLDAKFDNVNSDGKVQLLADHTFRLTPKHSGSAGFTYQFGLGRAGFLALNLSATFKSKHFFDDENTPGLYQDGYTLFNSALQYTSSNGKYGLRFNMNNMTNERFLIDAGNTGLAFGIPTFVPGAPRIFGTQLFYNF
jgi:outer membrane receptor protein involved in Fe transport